MYPPIPLHNTWHVYIYIDNAHIPMADVPPNKIEHMTTKYLACLYIYRQCTYTDGQCTPQTNKIEHTTTKYLAHLYIYRQCTYTDG